MPRDAAAGGERTGAEGTLDGGDPDIRDGILRPDGGGDVALAHELRAPGVSCRHAIG
jgi:hypothetical protein